MLRMRCLAHGQSFEHRPSASKCPEAAAVLPDCLQLSKQASSQPGIECVPVELREEIPGGRGQPGRGAGGRTRGPEL